MHRVINKFLESIPPNVRSFVWYTFIILLVVVACILTGVGVYGRTRSKKKSFVCGLLALISFSIVILVALLIEKLTNRIVLLSGVTYYTPYLACAGFVISKYLGFGFWEMTDVIALSYLPGRAVNIIGCTITGCCQGIPVEWGLYSAVLKENVIPVQLIESAAILIMWLILNGLYQRKKYSGNGKCTAYSLILFGGLNVATDQYTYIQPKLINMTSVEGIFAFITLCIGLIMLYILDKKRLVHVD